MNLREGQLLQVVREHFTISKNGIIALFVDDLILVVEATSTVQGRVLRMSDGVETCITTLGEGFDIEGFDMVHTYVEVMV